MTLLVSSCELKKSFGKGKLTCIVAQHAAERREAELQRVRQIYIPELVLRLHFMLVDTSSIFPS